MLQKRLVKVRLFVGSMTKTRPKNVNHLFNPNLGEFSKGFVLKSYTVY